MKIKKRMLAGFITVMMSFSLVACGNEGEAASESQSEQVTQEETESREEKIEIEASSETDWNEETEDESNEGSAEFEIPIQEDFKPVAGLSENYADMDNRSFAYNGKVFTLGESTLKDLIDGGIPFDESDLNNKGNNVNCDYETDTYTARINDYVTMQFRFINITEDSMTAEECLLSSVRYYYLYVPQPDYDADMNVKITENILDAANTVCFSFPATLTKEQLLENSSEGVEQDERNNVNYYIDSEIYMGSSGYHFEFNKVTNQLEEVSINWLP